MGPFEKRQANEDETDGQQRYSWVGGDAFMTFTAAVGVRGGCGGVGGVVQSVTSWSELRWCLTVFVVRSSKGYGEVVLGSCGWSKGD